MDAPLPRGIQPCEGFALSALRATLRAMNSIWSKFLLMLSCLAGGCGQRATMDHNTPPGTGTVRHVDASGAEKLIAEGKILVLDVRTPVEYQEGHIKNARLLDFQSPDFATKLGELDRDQTVMVHCAVGGRSAKSLATFEKLGFKDVVHLDGVFKAWAKAGKPVEK
jgi:phage shock protein E